jgi:ribonuclease HI
MIEIWTDGSCNWKTGDGGIGIYIRYENSEKSIQMGYRNTKTGRMELKAVILALNEVKDKSDRITFYCDSMYVINSITLWLDTWIFRSWIGVANKDLWEQFLPIYNLFNKSKISFVHVKGHTDNCSRKYIGNAIVDELASYKNQVEFKESDLFI